MESFVDENMKACGRAFSRKLQSIIEYYDSKKSCHDHCCDSRLFALHLEEKMEKSYPVEGYGTKREMPFVIPARIREIHRQFLLLSFLPKVITYAPCYYRAVGYDIVKKIENEIYNQFSTLSEYCKAVEIFSFNIKIHRGIAILHYYFTKLDLPHQVTLPPSNLIILENMDFFMSYYEYRLLFAYRKTKCSLEPSFTVYAKKKARKNDFDCKKCGPDGCRHVFYEDKFSVAKNANGFKLEFSDNRIYKAEGEEKAVNEKGIVARKVSEKRKEKFLKKKRTPTPFRRNKGLVPVGFDCRYCGNDDCRYKLKIFECED